MIELLKITNLNKNFGDLEVLKNINLTLKEGEILTLLGESGCGKSTLLRIIAGLENKDSGDLCYMPSCGIAMMFQNYALFPHLNVYENIEFAIHKMPKDRRSLRINELLEKFKIKHIKDKMCDQISGGQAQRVAFARAVANKEKLLLLDEPFANLDHNLKSELRYDLKEMIKQNGLSAIMVTHDKEDAFLLSDRIAFIKNGSILDINSPKNLYFHPKSYETAKFLGHINIVDNNMALNLPDEFYRWLKIRNFMFRPEEICQGKTYSADVLKSSFLGSFCELFLKFDCIEFKAMVPSNFDIKDKFVFDLC